jgi:hypothetical protein
MDRERSSTEFWGPTNSSDYPLLMGIISTLVTLGLLGAIFPVIELVFGILIPTVLVAVVLYTFIHWLWDEYRLNQEIKKEVSK